MQPTHIAFAVAAFLSGMFIGLLRTPKRKGDKGGIYSINQKLEIIMATIAELNTKLDELQTKLDAEQEQIASAIATLQATVEELRANQNDPAAIDAAIAKVDGVIADLESTVPDGSTEPTEPQA